MMNNNKSLTILVNSTDAIGSMNPVVALAQQLKRNGHHVIFAASISYRERLEKYGFLLEPTNELIEDSNDTHSNERIANFLMDTGVLRAKNSLESLKALKNSGIFENYVQQKRADDSFFRELVVRHKPDIIVVNNFCPNPFLVHSGIPWVGVFVENALPMYNSYTDVLPPYFSGYATDRNAKDWAEYKTLHDVNLQMNIESMNDWYTENGFPKLKYYFPESPHLNIYGFTKELDYTDLVPKRRNWFRVDDLICLKSGSFTLPKQLINASGKLIYLSMGTLGSINVEIMKKFVTILSKSPHRFLVSKGSLHNKYELADNMWGEKFLPQTSILPLVDLVITHGGNNSVMETFYFGKPMIVFPIFLDQYDNAQRIHEKQFGIRLNTFEFTENELLDAIETLLIDVDLRDRLERVSKRIQSSKRLEKAAKLIETLVN